MSLKDFINKNLYDTGEPKKEEPVKPVIKSTGPKSFINHTQQDSDSGQQTTITNIPSPVVNNAVDSDDLADARIHINKLLADSNQPGIDYFEFVITKNGMDSLPEAQRYKVAYNSLAAAGLTKDIITKSATFYLTTIENAISQFKAQFSKVSKSDVDDKKLAITTKQQQMTQLSEQISKLNDEIKQLTGEVAESEQTLNSKNNAFLQAATEAKQTIQDELGKIDQYVQQS